MSETKMENDRRMSPIRGYPPLVRETAGTDAFFSVIGLSVIDAGEAAVADLCGDFSEEVQLRVIASAREQVTGLLSEYGQVESLGASGEMPLLCLHVDGAAGILCRTVGLSLDYALLRELAEKTLRETHLNVQLIVSSVYAEGADISLALDEVATLARHAMLLNLSSSVCGHRSEDIEKQFPEAAEHQTQLKIDLEKLFFNSVITLKFPEACGYFLRIMDLELKSPETALFLKTRVCNRLAGIIYTLGSPPNRGPGNPLKNNVMAEIDALNRVDTIDEMKAGVRTIFEMLEEDYRLDGPQTKLDQITAYIQDNYQDCNLDATRICDLFGITPPSLSRMFRRERGTTMLDYIHTVRLSHVKRMMLESDEPLQKIATQCGYFSFWTMSRAFKKYEGVTPSEYRRSCFEVK